MLSYVYSFFFFDRASDKETEKGHGETGKRRAGWVREKPGGKAGKWYEHGTEQEQMVLIPSTWRV